MSAGLSEMRRMAELHWICSIGSAGLALWLVAMSQRTKNLLAERRRERRVREEIEAYAYLDVRPGPDGDLGELSRRVCSNVAERSPFRRVAMLVRDAEARLYVAGSVGMEEPVLEALQTWAAGLAETERETERSTQPDTALRQSLGRGISVGRKSRAVVLGAEQERPGLGRAIVVPIGTTTGRRLVGALVVGADRMLSIRRGLVEEALAPLEALAVKVGRAMENAELAERLLRAEKLASLGLLAGGMAHALNNPLTAVMGFAELIAESADQRHVQEDAETILREARRMRQTVEGLLNFWRPSVNREEAVAMTELVRELAVACEEKLTARGVKLVVQAQDTVPDVQGNRDRLRQVLEHLLNNAAQAIASSDGPRQSGGHSIRVAVGQDARAVQVIVSDTGPGFSEPGRVFDPFYTTREPGEGSGLGLSICYGIVREHNGEISAFNLHPHGAAVVVRLPAAASLAARPEGVMGEVA
ncbi:sensor histidine kinase [Edaphobacter bradus]|uniref:sensor histidine kinase n=1 Tax=Edaphobacter bradus TaxID=2259016 RepID=UPI0021E06672|nr:HAMP domain-containing sensor histidine kinase [Edaphobacter bradus]